LAKLVFHVFARSKSHRYMKLVYHSVRQTIASRCWQLTKQPWAIYEKISQILPSVVLLYKIAN